MSLQPLTVKTDSPQPGQHMVLTASTVGRMAAALIRGQYGNCPVVGADGCRRPRAQLVIVPTDPVPSPEGESVRPIIVGFDGTDPATDALRLGADLAAALNAPLIVAAVFERQHQPGELEGTSPAKTREQFFATVFDKASASLSDVDYAQRIIGGAAPRATLGELALKEKAEMLVIGSTHLGPLSRSLAGAADHGLFDHIPCGLVVAPRGWARRSANGFERIGVGYNGTDESKFAVRRASELAHQLHSKLRLISVAPYSDPHLYASTASPGPGWVHRLMEGAGLVDSAVEAELVLRQGRPATELAEQARTLDLLVVGTRRRGRIRRFVLGSVSGELVRTSPCPVLVLPPGVDHREAVPTSTFAGIV